MFVYCAVMLHSAVEQVVVVYQLTLTFVSPLIQILMQTKDMVQKVGV